jgi:pimeloyl-ACP methyl ester carboxylesterase
MGIPGRENGTPARNNAVHHGAVHHGAVDHGAVDDGAALDGAVHQEAELWWDERGTGEPLVLLHGGLADSRSFSRNVPMLAERFHVYTPDARGHGHTPDVPGPITPELLLQDVVAFLTTVVGGPAHLAGHSMGATTALHVALRHPGLVRRLILVSASIRPPRLKAPDSPWPGLDELVRFLGPGYGEVSPDGQAHFPVVASKIVTMLTGAPALAQADLGGVGRRTLLMAGDEDAVPLDDTLALYDGIPGAELAIVPGTSHFLLREKPDLCNAIMLDFLTGAHVPAVPPVRRTRSRGSRLR